MIFKRTLIGKVRSHLALFSFLTFFAFNHANAANYYWVGGTGNWTDFSAHWATTSGGAVFHTSVPGTGDDVFFDANSFSAASQVVTIDADANFHDMDWTGVTNNPDLAGFMTMNSYGSITFSGGMTASFTGTLDFEATGAGNMITSNGLSLNASTIQFNGTGDWTMADDFNAPTAFTLFHGGTLNLGSNNINLMAIDMFMSTPRTLNLDDADITLQMLFLSITSGLTINEGTSQLTINNSFFDGRGFTFYDVTLNSTSTSANVFGSNTYNDLTVTGGTLENITFQFGSFHTINGTFSIPSGTSCTDLVSVNANPPCTISVASGSIVQNFMKLDGINVTGGASFTANNSIDLGNNSGWTINPISTATMYWVGGTGNWDDPAHWSTSSGGPGGSCIPTADNDVRFDNNSFSGPAQTVTVNTGAEAKSIDWTGVTNNPTFAGVFGISVYGSLTLASGMNHTYSGSYLFMSSNPGNTVDAAGNAMNSLTFNGTGDYTLLSNLNLSNVLTVSKGIFNSGNFDINTLTFQSNSTDVRTINLGSSIVTTNLVFMTNPANLTLNAGTSTINLLGPNFSGAGKMFYDLNMNGASATINDGNTFNDVTISTATTITFDDAQTNTMNSLSLPSGSCSAGITIKSGFSGTQATISVASGTVSADYGILRDINATGGATFNATNSTDLGNNTGWTITPPGGTTYYWIGNSGNWTSVAHWSLSSGGPSAGCIPGASDNVVFDNNSFSIATRIVTVNTKVYFNDMTWTGVTNNPSFNSAFGGELNCYGSIILDPAMNFNYNQATYLRSTNPGQTIDPAGNSLFTWIQFEGTGEYTLAGNLTTTSSITVRNGTFNTGNFTVGSSAFYVQTPNSRTINLGSSIINTNFFSIDDATNLTFNSGTSTINVGGSSFNGGGQAFNDVNINGSFNALIGGSNTFDNLNLTATNSVTFDGGSTNTFTTSFSMQNGAGCGSLGSISSATPGVPAALSMGAGLVLVDFMLISDVTASGGASFDATNSSGTGSTTGWNITGSGGTDYYWIGGTGNWSDTSHWSLSSGGPNTSCIPGINDNVHFDVNSFSGSGQSVTLNVIAMCADMDWTGATDNPTFTGFNNISINGSLTLIPSMIFNVTSTISFVGGGPAHTVQPASHLFNGALKFIGSGTYDLLGLISTNSFEFSNGTLNTNGHDINLGFGTFNSIGNATRLLNLGSSQVTTAGWAINDGTNFTLVEAGSHIELNNFGFQFTGGDLTYEDVRFTSFFGQIMGSNTFNNMTINPGVSINFETGETQTIHSFNAMGSAGNLIDFGSISPGSASTLMFPSGDICTDYLDIQDITAGGSDFNVGDNSIDNSGNTNVTFQSCPDADFNASITIACEGTNITFTDASTGSVSGWSWDFGAGASPATATGAGPHVVSYSGSGMKTIELIVTGTGPADTMTKASYISIDQIPTANAGLDQSVCASSPNVTLAGVVGVVSGGTWSNGAGGYTPNNTTLNAVYAPSGPEITAGNVSLILTSDPNGTCPGVTDTMTITIDAVPTASAGPDQTVCSSSPNVTLAGGVGVVSGGTWSGGAGGYIPNNTTLNAVYTPSGPEISAGTVTLTLTSDANGACAGATDNMTITIDAAPTANAGPDQAVCSDTAVMAGNIPAPGTGTWTILSGPGAVSTVNDPNSEVTGLAIGMTTVIEWSVVNGVCLVERDTLDVTRTAAAAASVSITPSSPSICGASNITFTAIPTNGGPTPTYEWFHNGISLGALAPDTLELVTPADNDSVRVVMTTSLGCATGSPASSTLETITVDPVPTVNAGPDDAICTTGSATLAGGVTNASGGAWSNGTGAYAPNANTLNATYTPSAPEITAGTATLALSTVGTGSCPTLTDTMVITINVCTGIDNNLNEFKVIYYPNPAQNHLTVDVESNGNLDVIVRLFDLSGRQVYSEDHGAQSLAKSIIDLSGLQSGVYLLHASVGAKTIIKRVLKTN